MKKIFFIIFLASMILCAGAASLLLAEENATSTAETATETGGTSEPIVGALGFLNNFVTATSTQESLPIDTANSAPAQDEASQPDSDVGGQIGTDGNTSDADTSQTQTESSADQTADQTADAAAGTDDSGADPQTGQNPTVNYYGQAQNLADQIIDKLDDISQGAGDNGLIQGNDTASAIESISELISDLSGAMVAADIAANASSTEIISEPAKVLAQWQMRDDATDDSADSGAQFTPSGKFEIDTNFKICAIASLGVGANQADSVAGQIFYPQDSSFGPNDAKNRAGCGQSVSAAVTMEKMAPVAGFDLFCEKIQKSNASLPQFATGLQYLDFCANDGKLLAGKADVYCAGQKLAYDDISGDYKVAVIAKNQTNEYSDTMNGSFNYLPLSAYDIDFSHVEYGKVKESVQTLAENYLSGQTQQQTGASIRNLGNVRLKISVWQDDMGLGKTDGIYNVAYQAKFAQLAELWTKYQPFETAQLDGVVDLSKTEPVDFAVTVLQFPENETMNFNGQLKIEAAPADNYSCTVKE